MTRAMTASGGMSGGGFSGGGFAPSVDQSAMGRKAMSCGSLDALAAQTEAEAAQQAQQRKLHMQQRAARLQGIQLGIQSAQSIHQR